MKSKLVYNTGWCQSICQNRCIKNGAQFRVTSEFATYTNKVINPIYLSRPAYNFVQFPHFLNSLYCLKFFKILKSRKRLNNNPRKTSALVGTVYYTHRYFVASRWRTPAEVYFYFRESILRQAVESPPASMEVFEPEEAKDCVIFFCEAYMRNLPLVSILHLPHYKLHLSLKNQKPVDE